MAHLRLRAEIGKWALTRLFLAPQAALAVENNGPPTEKRFLCLTVEYRANPLVVSREASLAEPY